MHDRGQPSEPLRHVLKDIAHAERVLLHHSEAASDAGHAVGLKQHAQQLITHLQRHAQRSHGALITARSQNLNARSDKSVTSSISEEAVNASTTALRSVFDSNLLSELCAVLHSLYIRQARLAAPSGASAHTAEGHAQHVHDSGTSLQADCIQDVGSASLAVNSMAAESGIQTGQSAEPEQHNLRPHSLTAALEHPQQFADACQQVNKDSHQINALRSGDILTCWSHLLCTTYQAKLLCAACNRQFKLQYNPAL